MMNRPTNQSGAGAGLEGRLRMTRIIWGALLASVGLYVVLGFILLPRSEPASIEETEVNILLGPLLVFSLILVYVSFMAKNRMLAQAADRQRPESAQTAIILGLALSEAAAVFGLVGIIVTGNPLSFGIIAVGAVGIALHFPRREQFDAVYRKGW